MNRIEFERLEQRFEQQRFSGFDKGFCILRNEGKILLSACHSVDHWRDGRKKHGEYRTGVIVKKLCDSSLAHGMVKTQNLKDDANYDKECRYKSALIHYIVENGIKLLFDFHISDSSRSYDIDLGTGYGRNLCGSGNLVEFLQLQLADYDVRVDDTFSASSPWTVSAFVAKRIKIPAVQIELNWRIIKNYEKTMIFVDRFKKVLEYLMEDKKLD